MSIPLAAPEVLDAEFLQMRAKLLQLAAAFDRLDRADGSVQDDPRVEKLRRALGVLAGTQGGRAEQLQLIFSLPYEENWRQTFFAGNGSQ